MIQGTFRKKKKILSDFESPSNHDILKTSSAPRIPTATGGVLPGNDTLKVNFCITSCSTFWI
ncbi:hypothetical protein N431DRAFT_437526 [Stipitochalara longipes BDJ]|nr:hypothetical protein N431DRAFT_437526 [Stipitochalara longipes BDJ]